MVNNLEHFIEQKFGKGKRNYFASLLWRDKPNETKSEKVMLSNKINKLINSDPKTLSYGLLLEISELLEIKIDQLWQPRKDN